MISDSFCSLNIGCGCTSTVWAWPCLGFVAVQALYNHRLSAQHAAVSVAPQIWSFMTKMLDAKNICIVAIILSKTSDSEPICPWLKCFLSAACLGLFDVRTLPPADSLLYTIRDAYAPAWLTEDMWDGVAQMLQNNISYIWQLLLCFLLLSCQKSGVNFICCRKCNMFCIMKSYRNVFHAAKMFTNILNKHSSY